MVDSYERRTGVCITEVRVWCLSPVKNLKKVKIHSSNTVEANRNDGYLVTTQLFSFVNSLVQVQGSTLTQYYRNYGVSVEYSSQYVLCVLC